MHRPSSHPSSRTGLGGAVRPSRSLAVRAAATSVLVAALALVPGAAQAAGHRPPPVNHAPDAPSAVRTTAPDTTCSTTPAPLRSTTPTLRAVLSDRDGDALTGTFEVHDRGTGRRVWSSGPTAAQPSGSEHAVQVPDAVLRDGGTYEWRVRARDARHRPGPVVRCRVVVDTVAPGLPTVTPVAGGGAVYAEDATAGGVGVAGTFALGSAAQDGVVAYVYGFDGGSARVDAVGGSAQVTWTPTTDGPHQLTVQAVDAAGNTGPQRLYRFTVASAAPAPTADARWTFDTEGVTVEQDALAPGTGPRLTLSSSLAWVDGLRNELSGSTSDLALRLDEATDAAVTDGPLLDTAASWSVAAVVQPAVDGLADATVVSQGDADGSAFRLGVGTTGCAEGSTACWSLTVAGTDAPTTVVSAADVVPGHWYVLFGVRDAASGTVRLDVCSLGSAEQPGSPAPLRASAAHEGGVARTGAFRLGGAPDGTDVFLGSVSGVQTWGSAVTSTQERLLCSRGGV